MFTPPLDMRADDSQLQLAEPWRIALALRWTHLETAQGPSPFRFGLALEYPNKRIISRQKSPQSIVGIDLGSTLRRGPSHFLRSRLTPKAPFWKPHGRPGVRALDPSRWPLRASSPPGRIGRERPTSDGAPFGWEDRPRNPSNPNHQIGHKTIERTTPQSPLPQPWSKFLST